MAFIPLSQVRVVRVVFVAAMLSLALLLTSCNLSPASPPQDRQTTPPPAPSATPTSGPVQTTPVETEIPPLPSATSQPTATPLPSDTPTPTEVPEAERLQATLRSIMESDAWRELAVSSNRAEHWRTFSAGEAALSDAEMAKLKDFIGSWEMYQQLLAAEPVPADAHPGLRIFEDAEDEVLVLYVIDETMAEGNSAETLFLITLDADGQPTRLLRAPTIEGLEQHISADGLYVEYRDDKGQWIIKADARVLDENSNRQKLLKEYLFENGIAKEYVRENTYPRYYYNIRGVESGFYALGDLTYNQILLLKSTLETFNQGDLAGLNEYMFKPGDEVVFIISRLPHPFAAALALPLGGSPQQGIVVLFSKNLFDNKYDTAAGLAHEAAHIWQGRIPACDSQAGEDSRLAREIGKGEIPLDFYSWTADQLYSSVRRGEIGAYHLSLWVANNFSQTAYVRWLREVITSGRANGNPLIDCYP